MRASSSVDARPVPPVPLGKSGFFVEAGLTDLGGPPAGLAADHMPHFQSTCAFNLDGSSRCTVELVADQVVGACG
jgi:hypothetical protein